MAVFVFGLMLVVMGALRIAMKGDDFGFLDILFVVLLASAMALFAYFRPRAFRD
jgi:hypothetical protein